MVWFPEVTALLGEQMAVEFLIQRDDLTHAMKPFFRRRPGGADKPEFVEIRAHGTEAEFVTADFVSTATVEVAASGCARVPFGFFETLFRRPQNLAWTSEGKLAIRIDQGEFQAGATRFAHPDVIIPTADKPTPNDNDLPRIRMAFTRDIHPHPELSPKRDEVFVQLMKKAVDGEVPVYFAAIPLAHCIPADVDYRPDQHPVGKQAIQATAQEGAKGNFTKMIVYPRGAWFVVADDYIPLFAALLGNPDYVPCWVLGKPEADYARDIQGPIDAEGVREVFGLK